MDSTETSTGRPWLVISFTAADGVTLDGSTKGDGVWDTIRAVSTYPRLVWRGMRDGSGRLYCRGTRDKEWAHYRAAVAKVVTALEAAGWSVRLDVDPGFRTAAEREDDRADRVAARVDRLDERAGKAAAVSTAAREAARSIGDGIPFGQPKLTDHYSYGRACRDEERMQTLDRRSWDAADKAERLSGRADGAAANEAAKHDPRAIMRRIGVLEADIRTVERELSGYVREDKDGRGRVVYRDEFPPATGQRAEDLRTRGDRLREDLAHQRAKLAAMADTGEFVAWAGEHFQKGDFAKVGGRWCEVARINRKGVSVYGRFDWHGDGTAAGGGKATPVEWSEIHGRRRDGMQWDKPNGQPWPVELARKVARWRDIWRTAHGQAAQTYGSDEYRTGRDARYAVRIVHGLALDACEQEARAVSSSVCGTDACRALAAAYLAVFEQLQAGEMPHHLAAEYVDVVAGDPAWRMPTDREPVRARAARIGVLDDRHNLRFLEPGDLIAGEEGGGFFGGVVGTIVTRIVGPVAKVSPVRDRRESGEWVTLTLDGGEEFEIKASRWFVVHPRGTWQGTAAAPQQLPEPEPEPTPEPEPAAVEETAAAPVADPIDGTRAVRRDLAALADVSTGCRLTDGTAAIMRALAADIAGEDVHAGRVVRLVRGLYADTFAAALSTSDALYRLRTMRCPQHIRGRIEKAAADIAAFLRVDASAVAAGSTVRMRMSTGDGVSTVDVVADSVTRLGCGCVRVRAVRPDGRDIEGVSGECAAHTAEFDTVDTPAVFEPGDVVTVSGWSAGTGEVAGTDDAGRVLVDHGGEISHVPADRVSHAGDVVRAVSGSFVKHHGQRLRVVVADDRPGFLRASVDDVTAFEVPGTAATSHQVLEDLRLWADRASGDPVRVRAATFADPVEWAKLPAAARAECAALDHGAMRCPHHRQPYPPATEPATEPAADLVADPWAAVVADVWADVV